MSDNEDLLGDDLGDHSLADYNLGNEEEEQLLADDYENGPQNVPTSVGVPYRESLDVVPSEYSGHALEYNNQPLPYQAIAETECVVPNITVEVPNTPLERPTYAPYEPRPYEPEHAVPPAIPAAPIESPQIVPSDINTSVSNGDMGGPRERFISERPPGAQRMPQVRDIPDSLDKVIIPRGFPGRGRTTWRSANFAARYSHPYRRNNMHRGNFNHRASFPPPHIRPTPMQIRPDIRHEMRPDIRPEIRPVIADMRAEIHPDIHAEIRPDIRRDIRPDIRHDIRQDIHPDIRPDIRHDIRQDIRHDIHQDIRPDIRHDIRPDIRQDIRPDIRQDIRPDIRQDIRPDIRPDIRQDIRPDIRQDIHPDIRQEMRPDIRQDMHPDIRRDIHPEIRLDPQMGPEISPERPILPDMPIFRPSIERPPFPYRFQYRPNVDERQFRPNFDPRPVFFRPNFPRQFAPPVREIAPNTSHLPQVTIRQVLPMPIDKVPKIGVSREQEVRMLPVSLPPTLPPGGLAGKKVLINPHFKGNFQPPAEGLPTYIPTRIQKSPPLSPTIENKFGPVKDIDDAAERFIAEQRNALARAAVRKYARRSPQRYIENTTIEIENELAQGPVRRRSEDELSRRQEEFISANRAGLRRRMRSPSPVRRSVSPRRSPERRRNDPPRHNDEDTEYKRRLREQESLRERVLRAKEVRRRKNAVALHKQLTEKDREPERDPPKVEERKPDPLPIDKPTSTEADKPDTTRKSPDEQEVAEKNVKPQKVEKKIEKVEKVEKVRERSPVKESVEVNSTCEALTPPRVTSRASAERALTPPLPRGDSDDDLDLILDDIDDILSDDDDSGRFKDRNRSEPSKPKPQVDLRSKLPPKPSAAESKKSQRQKIIFNEEKKKKDGDPAAPKVTKITFVFECNQEQRWRHCGAQIDTRIEEHQKSPPRRPVVTSSTKTEDSENIEKKIKMKQKAEATLLKSRQRITFDNKEAEKDDDKKSSSFSNRRVILQRKTTQTKDKSVFSRIEVKTDPTQPNPGIFSRAVRTAIGTENTRIVIKKEPEVEFESDSEVDEDRLLEDVGNIATVTNLPHGMTDTRLKTLAGGDVQTLTLDREERTAKITFKTTSAAESFKKKFNNKMVAASRLSVTLR